MKVTNSVLQTTNYNIFKKLKGNRPINDGNLKRIIRSMEGEHLEVPLIVNEKMEVCEGQHRLEAKKQLKLPVDYIVKEGYGLKETQIMNSNSKDWKYEDYLDSYCGENKKSYLLYRIFNDKYKFGHQDNMNMLSGKINDTNLRHSFNSGTFKVKDYDAAVELAEKIKKVGQFYDGYWRRSFVIAISRTFKNKKYDHNRFLSKLSKNRAKMYDCSKVSQYLRIIDDIYNWKVMKKNIERLY